MAASVLLGGGLAVLGMRLERRLGVAASVPLASWLVPSASASPAVPPDEPLAVGRLLERQIAAVQESRCLLLGSRNPAEASCVVPMLTGQVTDDLPVNLADLDGGPGTKLQLLLFLGRESHKSPGEDFAWHQGRLRAFLENQLLDCKHAMGAASAFAESARAFDAALAARRDLPAQLQAVASLDSTSWPGYCFQQLNAAIVRRDLKWTQHWAAELDAAASALLDLDRWAGFLIGNYLTALDFQNRCASLFEAADGVVTNYDRRSTFSSYPAGLVTLNGNANFYEVERQGERMFTMPRDRLEELESNAHWTPASVWVPPAVRASFLECRAALSDANRVTWDLAARTPYEHTYLVNMLYRAQCAGAVAALQATLRRLDATHPRATLSELMSVLMYRGHSFAGAEWADRFHPQLVAAAADLKGSDEEAFLQAANMVNRFYCSEASYGGTFTLRQALASRRLDCVRATDMIAAVFRDAGRPRFGHVRWCSASAGHSVAAFLPNGAGGRAQPLLADALDLTVNPETWPDAYFHGHAWPSGMQNNPSIYAVELYVRGLDNYVWAEGYIVRGPNAGTLTKAAIPYLSNRDQETTVKVYDGPYPE